MTCREKKRFLNQYLILHKESEYAKIKMIEWAEKAEGLQRIGEIASGGGNGMQSCVEKMLEYQKKLIAAVKKEMEVIEGIKKAIESVNDIPLRLLLMYRYIDGQSWQDISEKMGYSERQIYRLHGKALKLIKL
ncbi:MAG: sigma-70 family RNA polymerase sigma factor [Oscillospiraceae bacterium]|nr:sigma-70 family RNA polymerase sigma factor [Oscillospiraceae bacterium]